MHIETQTQDSSEQPVLLVMENTMSLYRTIGEKYCRNPEVIEVR